MKFTDLTYDQLVRDLNYGFNESIYVDSHQWRILRSLYEKNYLGYCHGLNDSFCRPSIPKIFHQIWIGGDFPEEYKQYSDSWKIQHPEWQHWLWTDRDAAVFPFQNRQAFDDAPTNGQKSDIWRYEILQKYGGVYLDVDFECIKPIDDLMYLEFFTSSGYTGGVELYIGIIACTPQHPIINRVVANIRGVNKHNSVMDVFNTTGSYYFTKCFFEEVTENSEWVVAMPQGYFYPWPNNDRNCINPDKYIKPYSYGVHRWFISWLLRKK